MRQESRKSSINITVIDMTTALAEVFEEFKLKKPDLFPEGVTGLQARGTKWGYVETTKGLYLLDEEACGPNGREEPAQEGERIMVPVYFKGLGGISLDRDLELKLTPAEIRDLPNLGTENFADFVRRFGARLEGNFWRWNRHLQAEMAEAKSA